MKKLGYILILLQLVAFKTFAQTGMEDVEMADEMRNSGKIYVVVAVVALIFISLLIYLFSIDRRLKKIEKRD